jgi:N-acetylmuramoyl-L-alanine amidase
LRASCKKLCGFLIGVITLLGGAYSWSDSVDNARVWRSPEKTRLVFDLSNPANHKIFPLQNPDRLVIDLKNIKLQTDLAQLKLADTPIVSVRSAVKDGDDLRIVIDLKNKVSPRSFTLGKNEQYGDRLVVDLFDDAPTTKKTVETVVNKPSGNRDIIIAIDAGHGGEDPGALGKNGVHEKYLVLAIAKALKAQIDQAPGFKGKLVRGGDYFIPLRGRSAKARDYRADLFVSIHADGFKTSQPRGASVFALSRRGATSETAKYLAQRENRADLIGGVDSVSIKDKDKMLAQVLLDLSMTATLSSSLEVGADVLKEMAKITKLHKPGVEQAGFVVLKSPDIPSLLIETGFITNPTDAKNLNSKTFQKKLAVAIFKGVDRYFNNHAPAGTWLANNQSKSGGRTHIISRGDTLSEIAQRYQVSVGTLKAVNGLKGSRIKLGQKLKIPTG